MESPPALSTAIEDLYSALSTYKLRSYTEPCLHCHTLESEAKLHSAPLRSLGAEELQEYASDALLVWGDENDFRYFLPRIVELYFSLTELAIEFVYPEMFFNKFRYARWLAWPLQEQAAVRNLLHAVWSRVLGDTPFSNSPGDFDGWLCSIAQAEDDLRPYLLQWIEDERASASFALSSMLLSTAESAFWDDRADQFAQVKEWRKSAAVIEKLQRARDSSESSAAKNEFEAALECID